MLAVGKTKPEPGIELFERPVPKISMENEVLVEVGACGICGTDVKLYKWHEQEMVARLRALRFPRVLGHEAAGTVREVGRAVTHLKEGDRVVLASPGGCGVCYSCRLGLSNLCDLEEHAVGIEEDGAFARYVVTRDYTLFGIPEELPFEEAAVIQPLTVAVHALERSHLKPGEHVVVIGPGPIGLMQVLLTKANGAASVTMAGLDIHRARLQIASEMGAEVVQVTTQDLKEKVYAQSGGRGADVVFDCAGGSRAFNQAVDVARKGGEVVVVGAGDWGEFNQNQIVAKELTILGSYGRLPATWNRALNLVASKTIDLTRIISAVFPLANAKEAFQLLVDRKAAKVLLTPQ